MSGDRARELFFSLTHRRFPLTEADAAKDIAKLTAALEAARAEALEEAAKIADDLAPNCKYGPGMETEYYGCTRSRDMAESIAAAIRARKETKP
jgi:hypothetical protein